MLRTPHVYDKISGSKPRPHEIISSNINNLKQMAKIGLSAAEAAREIGIKSETLREKLRRSYPEVHKALSANHKNSAAKRAATRKTNIMVKLRAAEDVIITMAKDGHTMREIATEACVSYETFRKYSPEVVKKSIVMRIKQNGLVRMVENGKVRGRERARN